MPGYFMQPLSLILIKGKVNPVVLIINFYKSVQLNHCCNYFRINIFYYGNETPASLVPGTDCRPGTPLLPSMGSITRHIFNDITISPNKNDIVAAMCSN